MDKVTTVILKEMKQESPNHLCLNAAEINELKRLVPDMGCSPKQVLSDKNLLELFTSQFAIRMDGQKQYSTTEIATALRDLAD